MTTFVASVVTFLKAEQTQWDGSAWRNRCRNFVLDESTEISGVLARNNRARWFSWKTERDDGFKTVACGRGHNHSGSEDMHNVRLARGREDGSGGAAVVTVGKGRWKLAPTHEIKFNMLMEIIVKELLEKIERIYASKIERKVFRIVRAENKSNVYYLERASCGSKREKRK
ncbi:xylanase [Sesbania bispinosa]|nr:xylanase [Sesbania bispinosa]